MKKEKLLRAMSLADERFVDEAYDAFNKKKKRPHIKMISALAAVLSVIISLSLWLFIPLKDVNADISRYSDSEYYSVIQKLHAAGYRAPRYKNNFQKYVRGFFNFTKAESIEDAGAAPEADFDMLTNGTSSSYHEVTDNQVAGVIEADLIKRTDTHIFYLNYDRKLCILSMGKGEIALIGMSDPLDNKEGLEWTPIELYLVERSLPETLKLFEAFIADGSETSIAQIITNGSSP